MMRAILSGLICAFLVGGIVFLGGVALAQRASAITIDLSQDHVDITMGFAGSRFVVDGVKKNSGEVAMIIRGPDRQMVVRRKDDTAGIWMNRETMVFDNVPVYYDLALSRPARELAPTSVLRDNNIGLDALEFITRENANESDIHNFREALIRNRQSRGYLPLEPRFISFMTDDFFRAVFDVPADVPPGSYRVLAYLIDDGQIVDVKSHELRVAQKGFSARIYLFAHNHALAYGIMAVIFAMMAGWGAWAVMRRE